jgi:EAL domain-containing protein (putative c-di-GMP-specific phosphodiesterase class I)
VTVNLRSHQIPGAGHVSIIEIGWLVTGRSFEGLVVGIVETAPFFDMAQILGGIENLNHLVVGAAFDKFSAEFSSRSYLALLLAKFVKFDQTLVRPPHEGAHNDSFLETILSSANLLDMTVLAEGIETRGQLKRFRDLGCDLGHRILLSAAVPATVSAAKRRRCWPAS